MRFPYVLLALLVALPWPSGMVAAGQFEPRGAALANACAACHGPDGRSRGVIPSIDVSPTGDFIAAMKAFRTEARKGTVMNRIAKGLDDDEINAVAVYFATLRGR